MSIIIIAFFIIISFLPVASASTYEYDNVWAAKSAGFIKSNESISFENILIRVNTLDNTKATITIYKNQNLIETSDFNVNDFKKYDAIGITLLGIKGDHAWISISKLENKDIWIPFDRTLLKWGEKYAVKNYTVNIDTFGTDSVNLTVSNKSMAETNIFPVNGFKDYENLRIAVRNINRTGFIELELLTNKAPEIKAGISTYKDEYFPDENIPVTINTTSEVVQNIIGITLESIPPTEIQPNMFSTTGITGTKSFDSQITHLPVNSTITINAKIESRDYYNNQYITTVSKDIVITPDVAIIKRAPADTDDENVPVQLYVYNSGLNNKSIHIRDTIPEELTSKELDWDIELGPKNSTTLTYYVTPRKPGLYFLPSTIAQWNGKSSASKRVKMTMHMPYISATKTAVNNESQTDVKLVISNTGDRPAQVNVSDRMPDGYPVVSGETKWSGLLASGESVTLRYSLQGNIEALPAASATYRDIRGVIRQADFNVVEPRVTGRNYISDENILPSEPYEIILFIIFSFIMIAGIIMGVILIAYLFMKKR